MPHCGAEMALSATFSARFSPVFRHISANVTFQKIANHREYQLVTSFFGTFGHLDIWTFAHFSLITEHFIYSQLTVGDVVGAATEIYRIA